MKTGKYKNGYFIEPTVFTGVTEKMTIFKEEIFGPVTAVIECKDLKDGIRIANNTAYGLSAAIYTGDVNKAYTAMRDVYTGIFYINAPTIGAEVHVPFGGTNDTGNGHLRNLLSNVARMLLTRECRTHILLVLDFK